MSASCSSEIVLTEQNHRKHQEAAQVNNAVLHDGLTSLPKSAKCMIGLIHVV